MEDDLRKQQHFLKEVEQTIIVANREVIHTVIPKISKDSVLGLAVAVSKVRAAYLQAILNEANSKDDAFSSERTKAVREQRERYEEAVKAFEALRHNIERGYVELDDSAV